MSTFISVPVLWNSENSYQANSLVNIQVTSTFVQIVPKPIKPYRPGTAPDLINTLQVNDPNFGALYLNMSYEAYQAAIIAASGSNSPLVMTLFSTITAPQYTITSSSLSGATIISIWKGGITLNPTDYTLSGDAVTFISELQDGDTVGIIYYTS